jgi:NADH-quinone oxidoreductase subunit M
MPLLAFFLILSSLGSAAVPGLNGFVGEFPILVGSFARFPAAAVFAGFGIILGAYYLFVMLQRVVFGPLREPEHHGHEQSHDTQVPPVRWYEIAGLAPLLVLIVLIGVYPKPFFDRITPSVEPIVARFPEVGAARSADSTQTVSAERDDVPPRAFLAGPAQVIAQ